MLSENYAYQQMQEIKGKPWSKLFSSYVIEEEYQPDPEDDLAVVEMKKLKIEWNQRLPEKCNTTYNYGPVDFVDL